MKNFINFPYIKFSKADLCNWAKKKYIDSETTKVNRAQEKFSKYMLLYSSEKENTAKALNLIYRFDPMKNSLYNLIRSFTYKTFDKISFNYLVEMFSDMGLHIDIEGDELVVRKYDFSFSVMKLSKMEPEILKTLPDIEDPERRGKCHPYGVLTALHFHKKQYKTQLVTGRIYQLSPGAKYLHSWVEIEKDGQILVIDPTKNAVMSKQAYYFINNVSSTVRLDASDVKKDFHIIEALTKYDNYVVKVYYENPKNGRKLYEKLVCLGEIGFNPKVEMRS